LDTHRSRRGEPARTRDLGGRDPLAGIDPLVVCRGAERKIPLAANRDLIVAGERHAEVYVVQDGWVLRSRLLHDGRRQIVDFVLPGDIVGLEACLFGRSLYAVTTITPATLSVISLEEIERASASSPEFSRALLWSAVCRGAILGEHLVDAA